MMTWLIPTEVKDSEWYPISLEAVPLKFQCLILLHFSDKEWGVSRFWVHVAHLSWEYLLALELLEQGSLRSKYLISSSNPFPCQYKIFCMSCTVSSTEVTKAFVCWLGNLFYSPVCLTVRKCLLSVSFRNFLLLFLMKPLPLSSFWVMM